MLDSPDGFDPGEIASAAELIADLTRARLLHALLSGPATVSELSDALRLPQPRVSTHLAVLSRAGVVSAETHGRRRIYRTDTENVAHVYEAISQWRGRHQLPHGRGARATREVQTNSLLRQARTCYDHLAGVFGVTLLDEIVSRGWIEENQSVGARVQYRLTGAGASALTSLGVDVETALAARRAFAFACPDWTEDRPHLGGALGHHLLLAMQRAKAVKRKKNARVVEPHLEPADWLRSRPS
jgi:DNA-binding transcriptional ArsR family regulator